MTGRAGGPERGGGVDAGRRRLLTGAGAAVALALAPGVTLHTFAARPSGTAASPAVRWGLLIEAARCADGCTACVSACAGENGWRDTGRPETDAHWIRKVSVRDPAGGAARALPVMCQHCADPPCAHVCPTGASFRRADGIVLVDKHICIGCRYCMMACPYGARSFVHESVSGQKPHAPRGKGTVEACTLCVHRVDAGRAPACVEACAGEGGAMTFGDMNDPASEIARRLARYPAARLRAGLGTDPAVRYVNP